jgi:hypothetical protein
MTRAVDLAEWPMNTPGRRLIESLTAARLLIIERDKSGRYLVRITHDALLNYWTLAQQLIGTMRNDIRLRDRLIQAKNLWEESGRASSRLLAPGLPASVPVLEAQELQQRLGDELSNDPGLIAFIRASSAYQRRFVGLNTLVVLAMITFLALITWQLEEVKKQRDLAEKAFADARTTVDSFISDISKDSLANIPGLQEIREDFATRAVIKYTHFFKEHPDDSTVRTGLAKARSALGEIVGSIGSIDEAEKQIKSAIALHRANVLQEPHEWRYRVNLAAAENDLSSLYWSVDRDTDALPLVKQTIETLENLPQKVQGTDEVLFELARGYHTLGNLTRNISGSGAGEPEYR